MTKWTVQMDKNKKVTAKATANKGYKGEKKTPKTRKTRTAPQQQSINELYDVKSKDIRAIMRWYGLTQVELAKELKKSHQYVSKVLSSVDVPLRIIKLIISIVGEDEYRVILDRVKSGKKPSFPITNRH